MAIIPDAHEVLALGADLAFPAVRVGGVRIVGEDGWRRALFGCPPASPATRARLLAQLDRELLVATAPGRARLRGWIDQQRQHPKPLESPEALRRRLRDEVPFYGDAGMLVGIVEALVLVPPPVRDVLLGQVRFVGNGWASDGMRIAGRLEDRPQTILLNGAHRDLDRLIHTVLHELGHAWATEEDYDLPAVTACAYSNLLSLAGEDGWAARAEALRLRSERFAEGCAHAWGLRRTVSVEH